MLTWTIRSLDGTKIPLLSYENQDISSLEPLPLLMVLPFYEHITSYEPNKHVLIQKLRNYRMERKNPHKEITSFDEDDELGILDAWDDDEELGVLDAWDVDFLKNNACLSIPCSEAIPYMHDWLEELLAYQPAQSAIVESWLLWLNEQVNNAGQEASFVLDLAELFAVGQAFERVLERCDIPYFLLSDLDNATSIVALESPDAHVRQMISHMLIHLQSPISSYNNETITFKDSSTNQIHALRLDVLHGRWDAFKSKVNPKDSHHLLLIEPAYSVARKMQEEGDKTAILLDLNRLWLESGIVKLYDKVLFNQIDLAYDWRQHGRYEESKELLELTQSQIQPLLLNHEELLKGYIRLLNNLSYLYITLLHTPRKAFDMLFPIIQEFDTKPQKWQVTSASDRARVRANFEASIFHLQKAGEELPILATMQYLSTKEEQWRKEQTDRMNKAIREKRPEDALAICNEVLTLLQTKNFSPTSLDVMMWKIDQARSLRDLGKMNEAITQLSEVIEVTKQTEHMSVQCELPRASIALAIAYERMGLREESKGVYQELFTSPARHETGRSILNVMRQAHHNFAYMLYQDGDFEEAAKQYQKAFTYAHKLNQEEGSEMLWQAYLKAKRANLGQFQHDILSLLYTTYEDSTNAIVSKRVKEARDILDTMEKKHTSIKEKVLRFFGCKKIDNEK